MNPPTPSETRNPTPDLSQQLPGNAASLQLAATLQLAQLLSQNNSMSQAAPLMLPQATSLQTMQSLLPLLGLQVNGNGNSGASSSAPVPQDRPVGMYQSDEEVLVHALKEADGKGLSYKQALEGLHGINGHLAHQWKDYYLEHARRINNSLAEKPQMWAKKPSLDKISSHQHDRRVSFSQQDNSRAGYSSSRRDSASSKHRLDESDHGHNSDSKRSRRDSPHGNGKGKQTLYDIPSREPTPPQHPVQYGSREKYTKYTDEDREYLIKYANFRLAEDPNLKKTDISHELARKAPHHSRMSWQSHWSARRPELDRYIIYYKDLLDPNAPSGDEDVAEDSDGNSQEEDEYEQSDEESDAEGDLQCMSNAGEAINDADRRVMSRYIASVGSEWDMLSSRDKWKPFEVQYPQRNYKAWTEVYRNHAKRIDPIVRKYRNQARARIQSQKATPAWARKKPE